MKSVQLALVLAILLAACARPTLPPISPEEIIARASNRMLAWKGFHFVVERSGARAYLDPAHTLVFSRMEGDFVAPDRAQGSVRVVGPGLVAAVQFINIGERYWETNPLSGAWWECPEPGACFNPGALFDPQNGIQAILRQDFAQLQYLGAAELEEAPGKQFYLVSGQLQGERLAALTWAMIGPETMSAQMWIAPDTFDVYRIQLEEPVSTDAPTPASGTPEPPTTLWMVDFLQFDQISDIQPPPTPAP